MEPFHVDDEMATLLGGMEDEDLQSFAELQDLANNEQIELYIYSHFLIFTKTQSTESLDQAIQQMEGWLAVTPTDHPDRTRRSHVLDMLVARKHQYNLLLEDMSTLLESHSRDSRSENTDIHISHLNDQAIRLAKTYERTGSLRDLNKAIRIMDQVIEMARVYIQPFMLSNLGAMLGWRFKRTGSIDDLNCAVDAVGQAVDAIPADHPDRASCLNNLGICLGRRFERTGLINNLNRAINAAGQAVDATPADHPNRAIYLNNLGIRLGRRFEQTGSIDDLNYAVDAAGQAVDAIPIDHLNRAAILNSFGSWLGRRFNRTGSIDDLNCAINAVGQAVDATPADHLNRASWLGNLGNWLGRRFERTGFIDDLNCAINATGQAVDVIPADYPDRAIYLNSLGLWLGRRFEQTGSIDDLNYAVDAAGQAVDATPADHPDRAMYLNNLGNWLGMRFDRTGSIDDLNRRLSSYEEGWHCLTAPPSIRIRLARKAAQIRASQSDWEGSSHLLQQAVETLPEISPRWLKHTDKQHMLADFVGLASAAAATALNAGKDAHNALRFLELGRGIIASLLIKTRRNISNLQKQHPRLADEFILLRDELDSPENSLFSLSPTGEPSSWESLSKRRRKAVQELDKLRSRIRAQPRFENFHLPPSIDELKAAAHPDPIIVVNLSPYRCDAFIIECHQVRVLGLPNLTLEGVHQHAEELRISRQLATLPISLLEWLWDIPTGLLSQLPLHAAGYHIKGSSETVLDRVISSYASTVKALIHGRQLHFRKPIKPISDHALLVAMRETPNLPANGSLPFTIYEVEMVKDLCPSLQLQPIIPSLRKDNILQELQACRIFHFAGHRHSDPAKPSRSCLLLEDWNTNPLTVEDLRNHRLQENPPFLSFLSACSTGANKAAELADEGINLINAFQLARFRHVVGTL
ncbi:CHAT domain-containing protein [Xylaria digitata]|nr:CHAT domain-containing protein [Xylaria digitata]